MTTTTSRFLARSVAARALRRPSVPCRRAVRSHASAAVVAKTVVSSDKAPAALGPYSQAIKAGSTVYVRPRRPARPCARPCARLCARARWLTR